MPDCRGCDCDDCMGVDCDHIDYEADILMGYATCTHCGHRWYQTAEELKREQEAQAEYDRMCLENEIGQAREFSPKEYQRLMIGDPNVPLKDDELPF